MKKLLIVLFFILSALPKVSAQDSPTDTIPASSENEKVYQIADQMPKFPGGNKALFEYLSSNIKYPSDAVKQKIQGKVIITFVVNKEGEVVNVKVKRSVYPSCDREALRVVRNMPDWIPGVQDGKIVSVQYTLPVTFKLRRDGTGNDVIRHMKHSGIWKK